MTTEQVRGARHLVSLTLGPVNAEPLRIDGPATVYRKNESVRHCLLAHGTDLYWIEFGPKELICTLQAEGAKRSSRYWIKPGDQKCCARHWLNDDSLGRGGMIRLGLVTHAFRVADSRAYASFELLGGRSLGMHEFNLEIGEEIQANESI